MAFTPVLLERFQAAWKSETEQYALRTKKAPKSSPGQGEFRWITIGAEAGADGGHHGGHHVMINSEGVMQTGAFRGKTMGEAFGKDKAKPAEQTSAPATKPTELSSSAKLAKEKEEAKQLLPKLMAISKANGWPEGKIRVSKRDVDKLLKNSSIDVHSLKTGLLDVELQDMGDGTYHVHDRTGAKLAEPSGIQPVTRPNEAAKEGDQLGLFGEAARPKRDAAPELAPGGETKGKQKSLFDTKGSADQSLLFATDDATPEDMVGGKPVEPPKLDAPEAPAEKASSAFDAAIDKGDTPRQAAEAAQKKLDEDYEFARASEVRNAGEDLKGSARHKVNQWKSLAEAEENGTAGELVTRDKLLKNEPADLMIHADRNPLTALAMHYAMKAFPAKPGTSAKGDHKKDREQYLEAYRSIKDKAEELARTRDNSEADQAVAKLWFHVKGLVDKFRGAAAVPEHLRGGHSTISQSMMTDKYNQTANDLVGLHKALASGYNKTKTGVTARMNEFSKALGERYGADWSKKGAEAFGGAGQAEAVMSNIAEHAKDIMEGKSLNATFGRDKKESNRFNPSEMYVKVATRNGGRDVSKITADPVKATKHLIDQFGMRGVQWGNSVTDDERKHHAAKAVEALTDLADTLGVHPKDITLGGKLGLAIGARGHGGALAHYEPGTQVINLTRKNGVGSLAHEWAHAFDHSLSEFQNGAFKGKPRFMSERKELSHTITSPEGRSSEADEETANRHLTNARGLGYKVEPVKDSGIRKAFRGLASAQSDYRDRLSSHLRMLVKNGFLTHEKARDYWQSEPEIFARTFERYVQHKIESNGRKNTYLAGIETKDHKAGGLWPTDDEVKQMAPAFDSLFEEYRKHKHGSPDVVKFSRREADLAFLPVLIERYSEEKKKRSWRRPLDSEV